MLDLSGHNLQENWRKFKQNFEIFQAANVASKKDEATQIAQFLNLAGQEAIDLYSNMDITKDDKKSLEAIMTKFEHYCNPRKNVVYERYLFYMRQQKDGEPFDQFLNDIKTLVKSCEFGTEADNMIRDRIVLGIEDTDLQAKLLKLDGLDLSKTIETCRIAEITKIQTKIMQQGKSAAVDEVRRFPTKTNSFSSTHYHQSGNFENSRSKPTFSSYNNTNTNTNKNKNMNVNKSKSNSNSNFRNFPCRNCNMRHSYNNCPAFGVTCFKCNRRNHFASVCRSNNREGQGIGELTTQDQESVYCDEIENLVIDEIAVVATVRDNGNVKG